MRLVDVDSKGREPYESRARRDVVQAKVVRGLWSVAEVGGGCHFSRRPE
jgi:hypothetical protein